MSTYPADASCAGHSDPTLWDAQVVGETPERREWRHNQARTICRRCPVTEGCAQDWKKGRDEGIRAATNLPPIHTKSEPLPRYLTAPTERARLIAEGVNKDAAAILAPLGARRHRQMKRAS